MECSKIALLVCMMVVALALGVAKGDIEKDREKCQNQLVALATCLPFVGGEAKSPTTDCCTGLKQVLRDSRECICLLIKDRNDPSLGLKINATLALQLPDLCKAPVNQSITDCPALLHLPPNSPDAKIFEDFAKGAKNSSSAPAAAGSSSGATTTSSPVDEKSDGGEKGRWYWWETQMIKGVFMLVVTLQILITNL